MDDYETLNKIGDGSFGTVYLCRRRTKSNERQQENLNARNQFASTSGINTTTAPINYNSRPKSNIDNKNDNHNQADELVAIKKMKKRYYNWDECMKLREIKALKKLNHKNVILLKEVIRENNHLYLVFEHMDLNLYQFIRSQSEPIKEPIIKKIIIQIIQGLAYIHRHGFFHRDIKPENLLCRNGANSIKIADFGLTREINSEPPYTDYVSTRWYRAPELLLHSNDYNYSIDIWAVGCIAGELYTLQPMFPGRSDIDQMFKICQVIGTPNVAEWPEGQRLGSLLQFNFPNIVPLNLKALLTDCSDGGTSMIKSILQWIPNKRPSARDLLNNSFFRD